MGKGDETRRAIVDEAMKRASTLGLEGISIGTLSSELGLSKSGLFAHFRSKENLQIQVLDAAAEHFIRDVVKPAILAERGEPRVRALLKRWLAWARGAKLPGGCIFVTAAVEFDDRPGAVREFLLSTQKDWIDTLERAARIAIEERHFRADLEPDQFAYHLYSIMLGTHYFQRLLKDPKTLDRAESAFELLIADARRR